MSTSPEGAKTPRLFKIVPVYHGPTLHAGFVTLLSRCLAGLGALFFLESPARAQPIPSADTDYLVDVWQTDQGLPQGTVTSIVQSKDGYLWLGTFNGLVRFDGQQFRVLNPVTTPGLGSGRVVQLFLDKSDGLWIGSEEGQVFHFTQGHFTEFHPPSQGSTSKLARQMCEDGQGGLWLLTFESTLSRLIDGAFKEVEIGAIASDGGVTAITVDKAGTLWAVTRSQVWVNKNGRFKLVGSAGGAASQCRSIIRAEEGGAWVACGDGRRVWLKRFTEEGLVAESGPFPWPNRPIYSMLQDHLGRIWMGMLGGGVYRCDNAGHMLEIGTRQGLPNPFVRSLCEDSEGNIWVGMQGGGLARLKPALFAKYRKQDGLSADQVLSVAEGEPGELWVGTNGEWLNRIRQGRVERFGEENGLKNGSTWSVLQDHQRRIWVGTWGGGLFRSDGDRFQQIAPDNFPVSLVPGAALSPIVLALFEDSQGSLWLGQHSYGSVTRLVNGQPVVLTIPNAPSNFDIRAIEEDKEGAIWLGTHGAGLYRYLEGNFTHFTKTNGLQSDFIWALHTDIDGALWIGTYQGGISCYHRNQLHRLGPQAKLPSDVICQILEDEQGDLWFGSYGGIFRVRRPQVREFLAGKTDSLEFHLYTKADGLPTLECTGGFQPSGCRMRDGRLCFPTVKGLAIINPKTTVPNPVGPRTLMEGLAIDGVKVWDSLTSASPAGSSNDGLPTRVFEVEPGRTRVEFRYTGLNFSAPDQVRFKHRLVGLDPDWLDGGAQKEVGYSKLAPGRYRFEVMAEGSGHIWSKSPAQMVLQVHPYIWQTRWFQAGVILLTAGLVAALARMIERRRQLQRLALVERQQDLERERLRIARDIHDDLGARLTEITLLSELARDDAAHGASIHSDLGRISGKARDLTRSVDEIVWAVNPSNDNLESLITYACSYAEDFLRPLQIRCRFSVPGSIAKDRLEADARHHIFLAFKEALTNIAKHSKATEVTIGFTTTQRQNLLSVADNGIGWKGDPTPHRNGLGNMRTRLEQIGGRCEIINTPDVGVRVTFMLPRTNV